MLGQTSQIFAEAEVAYRRERLMADFRPSAHRRQLHWPSGWFGGHHRQPRHPRHVMPAPHHLSARI
jgi:hypothetical protein